MSADARGIAGDRRRTPFPSLTETEYRLFLATVREEVRRGVEAALDEDCVRRCQRVEGIEALVRGDSTRAIVGIDERLRDAEATLATLRRVTWLAVGAMLTSLSALLLAVSQKLTIFPGGTP